MQKRYTRNVHSKRERKAPVGAPEATEGRTGRPAGDAAASGLRGAVSPLSGGRV
jgi:hypothetical protein